MFVQKTYGAVYCLISPSNKRYFGKTKNWSKRRSHYKNLHCHDQPKIYNALKKYGPDSFAIEIVSECDSEEELNFMEKWFIALYKTVDLGYNCTSGGDGAKLSEETKRKISESQKGKIISQEARDSSSKKLKGRKLSEEHSAAIRNGQKKMLEAGHDYKAKQKPLSEEHKDKIKNALKGTSLPENVKISMRKEAREAAKKEVYLFCNPRIKEEFFGSRGDFAKKYNMRFGRTSEIVKGTKHRGGWFIKPQDHIIPTAPEQNKETN